MKVRYIVDAEVSPGEDPLEVAPAAIAGGEVTHIVLLTEETLGSVRDELGNWVIGRFPDLNTSATERAAATSVLVSALGSILGLEYRTLSAEGRERLVDVVASSVDKLARDAIETLEKRRRMS